MEIGLVSSLASLHVLVYINLSACSGSGLGYIDGQDAVLQTGLDVVLIDRSREGEDERSFQP
jgi:hypothetical protein